MAKRTSTRTAIVRAIPMRAPAPIIKVSAPRAAPSRKKHHRRHRGGGARAVNVKTMMGAAIGGAVMGFVDKSFTNLPTLPVIGRAGTIALAAYMLASKGGGGGIGAIARDVALAAAAVAGYELGKEGKVSGDVMGGAIASQVSGLASQV
jgi:hypothetical protein